MCRAGGRRCEHNWTEAQRNARNAQRRANYHARKAVQSSSPSTELQSSISNNDQAGSIDQKEDSLLKRTEHENLIRSSLKNLQQSTFSLDRTGKSRKALKSVIDATEASLHNEEQTILKLRNENAGFREKFDTAPDMASKRSITDEILKNNYKIIQSQDKIRAEINKYIEAENNHYGALAENFRDIENRREDLQYDMHKSFAAQTETVPSGYVRADSIDHSDRTSIQASIRTSGAEYPNLSYWNEMGSSEKDRWEERMINGIKRFEK